MLPDRVHDADNDADNGADNGADMASFQKGVANFGTFSSANGIVN